MNQNLQVYVSELPTDADNALTYHSLSWTFAFAIVSEDSIVMVMVFPKTCCVWTKLGESNEGCGASEYAVSYLVNESVLLVNNI